MTPMEPPDGIQAIFTAARELVAAHPELDYCLQLCAWHAWVERQRLGLRIYEETWVDGVKVRRDVTLPDPEPPFPVWPLESGEVSAR